MTPLRHDHVTQEWLQQWYETEAMRNDQTQMYRTPWAQQRRDTVQQLLLPLIRGRTVLDVGCGFGMYSFWIREHGAYSVDGIDIAPVNIRRANERASLATYGRVTFRCQSWDDLHLESRHWDVVLATEVFEHAINPQLLARQCERLGSVILATAPISESETLDPWHEQGHLHAFTMNAFESLFSKMTQHTSDGTYSYLIAEGE